MKASTNIRLQEELEAARIAARSFVGDAEQVTNFMGKAVETLVSSAMEAGPGAGRDVLMERANGIRWLADMLAESSIKPPVPPAY
ncbi:MAG: hypothetical protein ACOVOD_17355 [Rhodoferax sp.]|jgi:hypothetical protein